MPYLNLIFIKPMLLAPAGNEDNGGMSRLASQFGGLASLANISLSNNVD